MTRTPSLSDIFREARGIGASRVGADRPAQWLALLHRVVPFDAAWLSLFDDRRHRFAEMVSTGYDERIRNYFGTRDVTEQAEKAGLTESAVPLRGRDLPIPAVEFPIWSDYYYPAGFREGLAVGLFAPDRRHVGMLVLSTEDPEHPTDAQRELIGVLTSRIAATVDPLRSLGALAGMVHDAVAGAVLVPGGGRPLPLSGLPGHPLLAEDSPLLAVIDQQAPRRGSAGSVSFLWPVRPLRPCRPRRPTGDAAYRPVGGWGARDGLLRVVVLRCVAGAVPLVVTMLAPLPQGRCVLNRRELVVLGLLLAGWSEQRIAVGLDLPVLAVAETVARVVAVLAAPDRHVALLRAARRGWFIPHRVGTAPLG
ncbi:hypothetical protein ACN28C_06875 [Plantactinospora sp. WMMC1484]|uniref:hypothetical protein n=1 Tax=Plantactinospora sp. WMMC1484 TaxID=3404122 RepID=UPI003BF56FB2